MQLGKTMGWLVRNSAAQSKSPGYDDFIDRLLGDSHDSDAPGADNSADAEDAVSSAIIACALFALGILSLFNLFGNSLLYPYGTFFPQWPELIRFAAYGIAVGATMIGVSAIAILMAGRAPGVSLALSIIVVIATSQYLAALGQMETRSGVNLFNGLPSLTIAGMLFVWYYLDEESRRLPPLVCGVIVVLGVFFTGSFGILEYLANGLAGGMAAKFDKAWLLYAVVLSCLWLLLVFIGGGTAHGFATVASPQISPFKTSALFLSVFNMVVWALWIAVLIATLTRKRNKSG